MLRPVPSGTVMVVAKSATTTPALPVSKRAASIAQGPARTLPSVALVASITLCPLAAKKRVYWPAVPCWPQGPHCPVMAGKKRRPHSTYRC